MSDICGEAASPQILDKIKTYKKDSSYDDAYCNELLKYSDKLVNTATKETNDKENVKNFLQEDQRLERMNRLERQQIEKESGLNGADINYRPFPSWFYLLPTEQMDVYLSLLDRQEYLKNLKIFKDYVAEMAARKSMLAFLNCVVSLQDLQEQQKTRDVNIILVKAGFGKQSTATAKELQMKRVIKNSQTPTPCKTPKIATPVSHAPNTKSFTQTPTPTAENVGFPRLISSQYLSTLITASLVPCYDSNLVAQLSEILRTQDDYVGKRIAKRASTLAMYDVTPSKLKRTPVTNYASSTKSRDSYMRSPCPFTSPAAKSRQSIASVKRNRFESPRPASCTHKRHKSIDSLDIS